MFLIKTQTGFFLKENITKEIWYLILSITKEIWYLIYSFAISSSSVILGSHILHIIKTYSYIISSNDYSFFDKNVFISLKPEFLYSFATFCKID